MPAARSEHEVAAGAVRERERRAHPGVGHGFREHQRAETDGHVVARHPAVPAVGRHLGEIDRSVALHLDRTVHDAMACGPEQTELENAVVSVLAGEVAYTIESDTLELRTTTDAGEIGLNLVAS